MSSLVRVLVQLVAWSREEGDVSCCVPPRFLFHASAWQFKGTAVSAVANREGTTRRTEQPVRGILHAIQYPIHPKPSSLAVGPSLRSELCVPPPVYNAIYMGPSTFAIYGLPRYRHCPLRLSPSSKPSFSSAPSSSSSSEPSTTRPSSLPSSDSAPRSSGSAQPSLPPSSEPS